MLTTDAIYKERSLIGHDKFLSCRQLNGRSVTRPFLSAKGVTCEIREGYAEVIQAKYSETLNDFKFQNYSMV